MKKTERARIISREDLTEDIAGFWLECSFAQEARAGQFVSFYLDDPSRLLPRPISICDINRRLGALRFVFRIVGEGTRALAALRSGDTVDVIGPLGNGYPLEETAGKRVLLVGGGLGVPPMLSCVRDLLIEPCADVPRPRAATCAVGYRHDLFLYEDLRELTAVYAATEDGSFGEKGTVIDAMKKNPFPVDMIFACGPKPMLGAVAGYAREKGIRCYVSMEERMACGVGACLGCVVKTKTEDPHYHSHWGRVCTDGPVFAAEEVFYE